MSYGGNKLELCENPADALRKLQVENFDVVVVDYRMPGISGDVIAREAKRINPNARVILITAFSSELRTNPPESGV